MNYKTVGHILLNRAQETPNNIALKTYKKPSWQAISWRDLKQYVMSLSSTLKTYGIKKGDHCAVISNIRHEVIIADLAIACIGAVSVHIYPSSAIEECRQLLIHSAPKFIFIEDGNQLKKISKLYKGKKNDIGICLFSKDNYVTHTGTFDQFHSRIQMLSDLVALGDGDSDNTEENFLSTLNSIAPEDTYTLAYSSGTSRPPKAIEISHFQIITLNLEWIKKLNLASKEILVPVRPLASYLGKIEFIWSLLAGWEAYYFTDISQWRSVLKEISPSILFCNPLMLKATFEHVQKEIKNYSTWKKTILRWAIKKAITFYNQNKKFRLKILRKVFLFPFKNFFGKQLKKIFLSEDYVPSYITNFYAACGLEIINAYGLSELASFVSIQSKETSFLLSEKNIELSHEGEIMIHGSLFNKNIIILTGDLGFWKNGTILLRGRKDNLLQINSNSISPERLEDCFGADKFISQILLFSTDKKAITAIVALNKAEILKFSASKNIYYSNYESLCKSPLIKKLVSARIKALNKKLSKHENIKDFFILDRNFSVEEKELTASYKLKRSFIIKKYTKDYNGL